MRPKVMLLEMDGMRIVFKEISIFGSKKGSVDEDRTAVITLSKLSIDG